MKAAVLHAFGQPLVIEDVAIGKPGPGEVLLHTAAVGLCHSDLHFIEGMRPFPLPGVLGHEVAGTVAAVGEGVRDLRPGDHVVGALSVFCGTCPQCLGGRFALCMDTDVKQPPGKARRLTRAGGEPVSQVFNLSGFAEQMLVHRNALVKIRDDMPLDLAALLGCAVITGTGAVFRSARVRPGSSVAVIGCGGVGLAALNGAQIAGAGRVIAVDTSADKLELARRFGATDTVDASAGDVVARVLELAGGVDYSFECIGLPATVEQAFRMLRPGGTATVLGLFKPGTRVGIEGSDFFLEKRLQGSAMGSSNIREDIPRLVELYLQGRLNLKDLVSQRIRLADINAGFEAMKAGRVARSVVVFDSANAQAA